MARSFARSRSAHAALAPALQRLPDPARQARPAGRTTTEIRRKHGVGTERVSVRFLRFWPTRGPLRGGASVDRARWAGEGSRRSRADSRVDRAASHAPFPTLPRASRRTSVEDVRDHPPRHPHHSPTLHPQPPPPQLLIERDAPNPQLTRRFGLVATGGAQGFQDEAAFVGLDALRQRERRGRGPGPRPSRPRSSSPSCESATSISTSVLQLPHVARPWARRQLGQDRGSTRAPGPEPARGASRSGAAARDRRRGARAAAARCRCTTLSR
jgi:hypothetical protein